MQLLPERLVEFLTDSIVSEQMCLPNNYPEVSLQGFLNFQDGYRINVNTGEYLTSGNDGGWANDCYVFAQNYFADPFVIFMNESEIGYPVYYARHGVGRWDFEKVADSLQSFKKDLLKFQTLEANPENFAVYISDNKDLNCWLWHELHTSLIDSITDKLGEKYSDEENYEPWIYGKLMLIDIGVNKIQVVSFLKQHFKITGAEALNLAKHLPIELSHGVEKFFQPNIRYLKRIGAEVIFIED